MKRIVLAIVVFGLCSSAGMAQNKASDEGPITRLVLPEDRAREAMIDATYPVTPGDLYRLTYQQGAAPSTLDILVGSDYSIQLNVFGKLNAAGMTFTQAKQTIEKAFAAAFPRSLPSLVITTVGRFRVFIKGEVPQARNVDAWGMSRLSEILDKNLGPYSSLRNIRVVSKEGSAKQYDFFRFQRSGAADQDPFLRPGDTVVISPTDRIVEIAGEIKRPGKYQPLSSEQLKEMIDTYGGGLTVASEISHIRIDRVSGDMARTLYVDLSQSNGRSVPVLDGDVITIPSKSTDLPVVFFEGAVTQESPEATPTVPAASQPPGLLAPVPVEYKRIPYSFRPGETLQSALASLRKSISPVANLQESFLIREGVSTPIPLDLSAFLSGSASSDVPLMPLDRIVIPAVQFSVAVYGDVAKPGNYPYTPSKNYRHYADLAGFADIEEIRQNIVIMDSIGMRRAIDELIQPGSRIYLTAARVTVMGAVLNPGNFTFRRDFSASDYVNLAGGFDPEKSTNNSVTVFDSKGKSRKQSDQIQPGDRVYVYADKFGYNFNKSLPVILSVLTTVSAAITIYALLR